MEYRRVGRGGAGNYYSAQDIAEAQKRTAEQRDIEAQKLIDPHYPRSDDSTQPKYASSGRGGAGNVTNTGKLTEATKATIDVTPALQEAKPPEVGHYGRGGAGNYRGSVSGSSSGDEKRVSEAWDKKYHGEGEEIEMELREPERAHLGVEKMTYDTPT